MSDVIIGLTLDRSGSMSSIWKDAEGGFNSFKNEQAEVEGTAWLILTAFDDRVDLVYRAWNVKDIPDLPELHPNANLPEKTGEFEVFGKRRGIYPRGSTALIDATVSTIEETQRWLEENRWFTGQVIQVVITDGHENASRKHNSEELKALVAAKEAAGWTFVYLAANVDAWATGGNFGFNAGGTLQYTADARGTQLAYGTLSQAVTRTRTGEATQSGTFFESDEQTT